MIIVTSLHSVTYHHTLSVISLPICHVTCYLTCFFFVYLWCWNIDCLQPDPEQANVYFSTDDLEAALMSCNNVLTTYKDPATKKWDTRMSNLTMKWDSSRKLLLEAVRSCQGLPSPNICPHCCEGKVLIRCSDCPKRFYCPSCDGKVHSSLPFHGREGFCKWFLWGYPSNNYHWWKWIKERCR